VEKGSVMATERDERIKEFDSKKGFVDESRLV
jgi:hypothetical protein